MRSGWMVLLFLRCKFVVAEDPEEQLDLKGVIERWNYPVEVHEVTTSDGYILELFRIPRGKNDSKSTDPCRRPAVLFAHGFGSSAVQWAFNLPDQSAAFVFADAGFDVFLANMRGTTYGRNHITLQPNQSTFWQFTLDEMSTMDVPAIIDKVLALSGNKQLYYVGHSQGNMVGFNALADNPQYNTKVKKFFALAPFGTGQYGRGPMRFAPYGSFLLRPLADLYINMFGSHTFFTDVPWILRQFAKWTCDHTMINEACIDYMTFISGPGGPLFNMSRTAVYLAHLPGGSSTWTLLHYGQILQAKQIMHFDYGNPLKNGQMYGQMSPIPYNYSQINTEVYLFSSSNDWVASSEYVGKVLIPSLSACSIMGNYEIPEYNHFLFAVATTTRERLYQPIIDIILKDELMQECKQNEFQL